MTGPAQRVRHRAGRDRRHQGASASQPGDVLVLICRGPMGAGMEETYQLTRRAEVPAVRQARRGADGRAVQRRLDRARASATCRRKRWRAGRSASCATAISIEIVIDRGTLEGSVNFVGEHGAVAEPREGARVLAARPPRPDLAPDPRAAGRHAALGGAAGRQRRHLGRLRLRRGGDRANAIAAGVARDRSELSKGRVRQLTRRLAYVHPSSLR